MKRRYIRYISQIQGGLERIVKWLEMNNGFRLSNIYEFGYKNFHISVTKVSDLVYKAEIKDLDNKRTFMSEVSIFSYIKPNLVIIYPKFSKPTYLDVKNLCKEFLKI